MELYTPQQIILGSKSQVLAYRGESEAGLVVESEYHLLDEKVWADGSDRTSYPPFDDEPELGEEPEPLFDWGKLAKNVLVGLAVVVAFAAVAALTVATLGAGPVLIGAVAGGALIGGAMGIGMMAVSDIARGEVSDMSDYALTGLKDGFIGAASGAIFGPGAAVGTAFARKVGMAGAEGAFSSIMDQVLRGEKINWSTVAKDAGIGMLTLGMLDSKVGQKFTGFVGKVGNKVTPKWLKNGVTKANAGFEKAVDKLSDAGSKLGKKIEAPKQIKTFKYTVEEADELTKKSLAKVHKRIQNGTLRKADGRNMDCTAVCVAVDRRTGRISIGFSGKSGQKGWGKMTLKGKGEVPVPNPSKVIDSKTGLEKVDERLKKMLKEHGDSREIWSTDNCAEFNAANRLMLKGSNLEDLHMSTYTNSVSKKNVQELYRFKEPCDNCEVLYAPTARIVEFDGTVDDLYSLYFK